MTIRITSRQLLRIGVLALAALLSAGAQAQLFGGDDEARRAILDLRQRFDAAVTAQNRLVEENTQLRRSMLDLQQQIQALKDDLARVRGQQEQAERDAEQQRNLQESLQALDARVQKLEGTAPAQPDASAAASADNQDKQEYDAALAVFRSGDFNAAQTSFAAFIKRNPRSSYAPSALFWLGNAQYATRNYKEAITNFRSLLTAAPDHPKAAESLLSIANCQVELKDPKAARATLETLIKSYPQSEAAQAGRERLARMK